MLAIANVFRQQILVCNFLSLFKIKLRVGTFRSDLSATHKKKLEKNFLNRFPDFSQINRDSNEGESPLILTVFLEITQLRTLTTVN